MLQRSRNLLLGIFALFVLLAHGAASGDWLETRRGANIKTEPHGAAPPVIHVDAGERLTLVNENQTNGYYRVRLSDGREGWVYRSLVSRHPDDVPAAPSSASAPLQGKLEVHVINVGQADAILIRCPDGDHEMLIDAADSRYTNSGRDFKARLKQLQADDNTIEVVVASHPHADHIGNMAWTLDTYPIDLYVDNGSEYDSATYRKVERSLATNGARYWSAQDEIVPDVDFCPRVEVDARVLRPTGFGKDKNPNDNSVVVRIDYGETSFLFVGDAEEREETLLLTDASTRTLLDCDFLKVGHHGSDTSSSEAFLDAVTPKIAAISCGEKNVSTNTGYKHPRFPTVQALVSRAGPREGANTSLEAYDGEQSKWKTLDLNTAVYVTIADGGLVFESDGHTIHRRP